MPTGPAAVLRKKEYKAAPAPSVHSTLEADLAVDETAALLTASNAAAASSVVGHCFVPMTETVLLRCDVV